MIFEMRFFRRGIASLALCGFLMGLTSSARADAALDLVFASDLGGDFYGQNCDEVTPRKDHGLLALASAIAAAKSKSSASLVIGAGGLLGPGSGARFLMHSVTGSQMAADLIRGAGFEVVAPGVQDLELANETFVSYLDELRQSGAVTLGSNLGCPKSEPMLCHALSERYIVNRGGLRVGLLAVIPEDAKQRVAPGHLHGAHVVPWKDLPPIAKKLRAEVDALVIAVDSSSRFGLDEAIALSRELDSAGAHADVLHVTRMDSAAGGMLKLELSNGTILVGTPQGGTGVTRVSLKKKTPAEGSADPRGLDIATERVAPVSNEALISTLGALLVRERQKMCEGWAVAVAVLPSGGLDRAQVTRLVLNAMRSEAHAEISLINTGAISDNGLPLKTATVHSIGNVLPFKAQVLTVAATGKEITDALEKYVGKESEGKLRLAGLAKKDGGLLINGRAINTTETYRVVTIDFLAAGGNGLLPDKLFEAGRRKVAYADLRQLVLEYLRERGAQEDVMAPLELEKRPLWRALVDIGIDLQNVTISNPGGVYDRPQLSRQPSLAFKLDGTVRGEMDAPKHLVQLSLRTLYGQSWLSEQPAATMQTWLEQETADLIDFLALYSYRGFSSQKPRLPTPYLSLGLESEFSRPDTRSYHHFELSGAVGMRLALPARISASLGIGVRSELLASPSSPDETESELARARFLLTTTIEMPKRALWPRLGNALLGEFSVTYSFTDPALLRSHELRGLGKLYVELGRPLYLTVGTELYLFRSRDDAPGLALDVTAGLKVVLNGHRQQF